MKPSYTVTKKARKSSRYRSLHRYAHVPNRSQSTAAMLRHLPTYEGPFSGLMHGLALMGLLRRRTSKHANSQAPAAARKAMP